MKYNVWNLQAFLIKRWKKLRRGFSLIELLVVIAIIGILAALVLVALGSAREKAYDARIKSNISQLRTFAEIIYDTNRGSYDTGAGNGQVGACFTAPDLDACTSADIRDNVITLRTDTAAADGGTITAGSSPTQFCIEIQLNNGNFLCIDNSGVFDSDAPGLCAVANPSC